MSNQRPVTGHRNRRSFGRAQDSGRDDRYGRTRKLVEPTVCRHYRAVFQGGRWSWAAVPEGAAEVLCQACHRIQDAYPAGTVILTGSYLHDPKHRTEIVNLVHNQEGAEKPEHPQNRIMAIQETEEGLTVTTTDIHLPRRIAEAIQRTWLHSTARRDGHRSIPSC